jgi:polysaccharide deacetylase family protein (PEP-CTERM system associated)
METANIFTVDVEEYYDAENIFTSLSGEEIRLLPKRIRIGAAKLLGLLERHRCKATFFVLGRVAEENRDLVREIFESGHEIASHGYRHLPLWRHTASSFQEDLRHSIDILAGITGGPIDGYRATSFSLAAKIPWFFDALRNCGIRYDSSVSFSLFRPSFNGNGKSEGYFEITEGILEFPVSSARIGPVKIPLGGGYFRAYPYGVSRWGLQHTGCNGSRYSLFYIHPWELDPEQPRLRLPRIKHLRHYLNLSSTEKKLDRLLQDMKFVSIKDVLSSF